MRRAWLLRSLRDLDRRAAGRLVVRHGDPADVVPALAAEVGADRVHVTADAGPYGRRRDTAVAAALETAGRRLVATGTPYAVGPGTVTQPGGDPYKVFSPFYRAWTRHGWPGPAPSAAVATGAVGTDVDTEELPPEPDAAEMAGTTLPDVGEDAALRRWHAFRDGVLEGYDESRNRPDIPGTSALSAHLKYGEIHPRTLLADIADLRTPAADSYRSELCWREFYADVLWHRPESARQNLRHEFDRMPVDEPGPRFEAWRRGAPGTRSWTPGCGSCSPRGGCTTGSAWSWRASSSRTCTSGGRWGRGTSWRGCATATSRATSTAGSGWPARGTDPAPFFRIFNPVTQGERFDPNGDYVRRYVPELRHLAGRAAHEPWTSPEGYAHGYPPRIVDHAAERAEALRRYEAIR